MASDFYFETLYPFQDLVLGAIRRADTGFYLTGGTAASRAYLHHRFSDDLDLFVNDDERFSLWAERIIASLAGRAEWRTEVLRKDERFVRCNATAPGVSLRIELVNDVRARVGNVVDHAVLGRIDTAENILANKVTALIDREEPKDLADIWGFCGTMALSLIEAIENAHSKAAGVFPPDLARILCSATEKDWRVVRWIEPPIVDTYIADLRRLGESLILW